MLSVSRSIRVAASLLLCMLHAGCARSGGSLRALEVTPTTVSLPSGTTVALTATAVYVDGGRADWTARVQWTSSDPGVVGVSAGVANGLVPGSATIRVMDSSSGFSGSAALTVTSAVLVSVALTPPMPQIAAGTGVQLTAVGTFSDSTTQVLTNSLTWSSSNAGVATVAFGAITSFAVGTTTITATDAGTGIDQSVVLVVTPAVLTSIAVAPSSVSIALGTTQQMAAVGVFSDSTTQVLTDAVTWSSSAPGIATISNGSGIEGLASGLSVGVTTLTATDPGTGINGTAMFTVTTAVLLSIDVTPATVSIAAGTDQPFVATGTYTDSSTQDLTASVSWSSSDGAVASVSNASGLEGQASGLAVGTTSIRAMDAGSGVDGATALTVTSASLVSIAVTPASSSIALGTTQQFTATGTYTDSSTQDLTSAVTWSSFDGLVASVSNAPGSEGLATSQSTGTTDAIAIDPGTGISGSTPLTVTAATLVSVSVTPATPSIALGTALQFSATGTYTDSSTQNLTGSVTWISSAPGVATISNAMGSEGLAASVLAGATTLTATDSGSGVNGSTTLTVTAATLVTIAVTPAAPSIALGTDQQFIATGTYTDSSTQDLTASVSWASSTTAVATVSNAMGTEGLASSAFAGSTTMTATDAGSGVTGSSTLSVTSAILVSIAVTPATPSIALGTDQQFIATGTYTDSTTQNLSSAVTWASSVPGVATISSAPGSGGLASSVVSGATTMTATDPVSAINGSTTLTVTAAILVSLSVTPATPAVALGTGQQFTATGLYTDSTTQEITASTTWSSSSAGVATISNASGTEGLASSVATGVTTMTATDAGSGVNGSTTLTVVPVALVSIAITPANSSIALGTVQQYTATGTYADASTQDITATVTWGSSSSGVATLSNASGTEGLATSASLGATAVSATDSASAVSTSTALTVTAATLVSIAVTPAMPAIVNGTDQQFTATGTYTDSTTQNLTAAVTWSSSQVGVATVSNASGSEGLASSAGTGVTTVTATDSGSGVNGSTALTVTPSLLVSIAVTPTNPSIALGTGQQFTATGTYTDTSTQDITASVTWESSSTGVATISNASGTEGLASSASAGVTAITATDAGSGLNGATVLVVTAAEIVSIAVTPTNPSVALGTGQQFTATGTYTDSSTQDVTVAATWTSSSTGVATISNASGTEGLASTASSGTTTITATDSGSGVNGSTTFTVTPAELVSIAVTPTTPSISLGTDQQFTATGTYTDATTQDLSASATWSSFSTGVATISNAMGSEGLATSVSVGATTITATDSGSGFNDSTTLTISAAALVSIAVTPANLSIVSGATEQFTATGTYSDASTQDITSAVTWSSSNGAVATLSNAGGSEGLATGVGVGTVTVTATDSGTAVSGSTSLGVLFWITFIGASSSATPASLDLDINTPTNTLAGDILVAGIAIRPQTAVITPPSGWTLVRRTDNSTGSPSSLALYWRVAGASEPSSHRWSFDTSTGSVGAISTYRGVDITVPVDVDAGQTTAAGLNHDAPSLTTTRNGTMLVTVHAFSSAATWTPAFGMFEAADDSSLGVPNGGGISLEMSLEFRGFLGATGTRTATASGNSDAGNAHSIALSPGP